MPVLQTVALPAYEISGPADAPVIVALGGISAHRHVASNETDPSPGWWEDIVGPGGAFDTARHRLLGIDFLDGGARSNGHPAAVVTTHDQADALAAVLDALDVQRIGLLAGASYGGMVALAFAERYPERVERLVVIGAAHEPHPMTTALRSIQRQIVQLALDAGVGRDGLALARQLGIATYRSRREFGRRFAAAAITVTDADASFPVERYLQQHGQRFATVFEPARFLALSLSADLHCVDPTRISVPTLLVAAEGDAIVPREQIDALARALAAPVRVAVVATDTGHDAFLTEPEQIGAHLQAALNLPEFP